MGYNFAWTLLSSIFTTLPVILASIVRLGIVAARVLPIGSNVSFIECFEFSKPAEGEKYAVQKFISSGNWSHGPLIYRLAFDIRGHYPTKGREPDQRKDRSVHRRTVQR